MYGVATSAGPHLRPQLSTDSSLISPIVWSSLTLSLFFLKFLTLDPTPGVLPSWLLSFSPLVSQAVWGNMKIRLGLSDVHFHCSKPWCGVTPHPESPGEKPARELVGSEMHPGFDLPGRSFSEACSALDSACRVPGAGLVQVAMNQVDTVD